MTTEIKSTQTARIRTLNDELRKDFSQGHAVMTTGVAALGGEAVARIVKTIEVYDDFCHENDPYEEHDFGSFEIDDHTIFFKIDYFANDLALYVVRAFRTWVWQFKRVSGSSGLKVQAAIACWCRRRLCSMVFRLMVSLRLSMAGPLPK